MKKILLFVYFSGFVIFGIAQVNDSTSVRIRNVVKFLPINLQFNSVAFEFERMINIKNSVSLEIGLPSQKSIVGKYGINANSDLKTAGFGTTTLRAAYRHYTGKQKLPKGFYLEPYIKYQQIKGNASIEGVNDAEIPYAGTSDFKFNTLNMGCQLGVQFLIAKKVSIDLFFMGLEGGFLTGNIKTTPSLSTQYDPIILSVLNEVIAQNIASLPSFIKNKLSVNQTDTQVIVKANNIPYPWFRGGVSFGIAF